MNRPVLVFVALWVLTMAELVSAFAQGQPVPSPHPQIWTIVIGVGNYRDNSFPDSKTSARNAGEVLQWFRRAGWDTDHQLLLSDFGNADPGRPNAPAPKIEPLKQNMDWAIRDWLLPRAKAGDLVVFYFAGQAAAALKAQGPKFEPRVDYYLLPNDVSPHTLEQKGFSLDKAVQDCVGKRLQVVCWLATSLRDQNGKPLPPPAPGNLANSRASAKDWLARLTRWRGVTVWLASDGSRGGADPNGPDELFTKSLLGALGQPGSKRNLAVCLNELQENSQLRLHGFRSVGGVPAQLTFWEEEFGKQLIAPKPEMVLQLGHAAKVTNMVSTVDGGTTITASEDSTIRVWSGREKSLLRVLPGHSVGVTTMVLSRDERWLISGGGRGTVLVHDVRRDFAAKEPAKPPHPYRVVKITLLPDGIRFVSMDRTGTGFLWDPRQTPLAPKPWPQGTTCIEVACGGKFESRDQDTGVVVTRDLDGKVRVFDSDGAGGAILDVPEGKPTAMAVSPDGRALALGFKDGKVIVRILGKTEGQTNFQVANVPIDRLAFSGGGKLAVGCRTGARLLLVKTLWPGPTRADLPERFDLGKRSFQCLTFSPSGEFLAGCTEDKGAVRLWRIDDDGPPRIVLDDEEAGAFLLGFTGDSRSLILADFNGAVKAQALDPRGDERLWSFPAHRGKMRQLVASSNRRLLLTLDEQAQAQIWDLKDRTCRWLRGNWTSGAFLDDDRLVLSGPADATDPRGRLVLWDRNRRGSNPAFFSRTSGNFTVSDQLAFTKLTLSADGTKLAASTDPRKIPLVCVWDTKEGRLTHWISHRRLRDGVESLSLSTDGRYLLTAGGSPASQVWDLNAVDGEIGAPAAILSDPKIGKKNKVTCAVIRPGHSDQVVTGHVEGEVNVWTWANGTAKLSTPPLVEEEFAGRVHTLCFTSDGRHLAAAGDGTTIWLGEMEPKPRAIQALDRLRPHHFEQINTLTTWPGQSMLISGSDDTTVRFWDIAKGTLWGTFAATVNPAVPEAAAIQELDWVLYTPDGHYDASTNGTKLVRFRVNDQGRPLDQFEKTLFTVQLSEQLLNRQAPQVTRQGQDPPPVSISVPPPPDPARPDTTVTITLTSDELSDLRLYHNDVLIPCGIKEGQKPPAREIEVPVRLVKNRNRFYVMASQDGSFDSRSEEVDVNYVGPMEAGRLHVIALGVGEYQKRRLQYAQRDAERLSEVLYTRGIDSAGQRGLRRLLPDSEVTRQKVEQAFDDVADFVKDRPQDTVVVFIAGHTGVFQGQKFCLLLPTYPFPADAPILVAARGPAPNQEDVKVDPKYVLPYSVVALNLMRLNALNRLVIVDACQAEAIFDDPQVRSLQKWMEVSSRQVRTSYVMAARRGEESLEAEPLQHGILTYALLRGMGAVSLANEPKVITDLGLPSNADFNKDGILSTSELGAYARQALPQISEVFPKMITDARAAGQRGDAQASPKQQLEEQELDREKFDQGTRLQSSESSFPLVPLTLRRSPVATP